MPQLIQRVPSALLALFGIKATGRTPPLLADEVHGVVDELAFLTVDSTEVVVTVGGLSGQGGAIDIQIPQNEVWWIRVLSIHVNNPTAGDVFYGRLTYQRVTAASESVILGTPEAPRTTEASSPDFSFQVVLPVPFLLPSGGRLQWINEFTLASSKTHTLAALISRFSV